MKEGRRERKCATCNGFAKSQFSHMEKGMWGTQTSAPLNVSPDGSPGKRGPNLAHRPALHNLSARLPA